MKKELIILTTHFGTNFSGGSTATCEIFSRLEDNFNKIIVIGTELGDHQFRSIEFIKYNNWFHALRILNNLKSYNAIFYGDFYNSFLFILARINFYFTYHDNWPELGKQSVLNGIRSLFYTNVYKAIFKQSNMVFTVSEFKRRFVSRYARKSKLIYNGFNRAHSSLKNQGINEDKTILMVGNIDQRKYGIAVALFEKLELRKGIKIDIYGNVVDEKLKNKLSEFPFVTIKGFHHSIPFSSYKFLLHTSISESFGMIFCESIYNGLPVVTFNVGGARELIDDDFGTLIKPYDLSKMKEAIAGMLEKESKLIPNPMKKFSWEQSSKIYLESFE
ncbi:MAG: glycosyltransferase family 4 protein [Cyclobacteriaceae bacterium]